MNVLERRKSVRAISGKFKYVREMLRISPNSMAARMGVSRSSYDKYEYGGAFPSTLGLKVLANDFNISLDWLIAGKGPMIYKEKTGLTADMADVNSDVKALLADMERIPLLRYEVLTHYHKFILEHKDLMSTPGND
ncbi:MAG: Helix-turn-helix protein [Acidobacteriota bacterium]|nr:Helix-turn-helix protein [Acidobacteriota bacterium]